MMRPLFTFAGTIVGAAAATGVLHQAWNVWLVTVGQATRHTAVDSIYVGGIATIAILIALLTVKK
jgi:hypothetical protein